MARDWSTMPLDLLAAISIKLEACEDFINFSFVCRWWNCVASSIKNEWRAIPTPWLLLSENNNENPKCLRKIFNLENNKCYRSIALPETFERRCLGSAYGWVAMIDNCLNVELFNPISKAHIPFPSLGNIRTLDGYYPKAFDSIDEYISWCFRAYVTKIVVLQMSKSCCHELVIVAFCVSNKVAVARPGDQSWTLMPINKKDYNMVEVVVMDDHVFGLYHDGRLVRWNANEFFNLEFANQIDYSPRQPHIFGENQLDYLFTRTYLVQSSSELFMVIRYKDGEEDETSKDYDEDFVYGTHFIEVFKLNPDDKVWEEIEELCGMALVVGCNSSMCVRSDKYLQENCIYFTDDENEYWLGHKEVGGHDMGVFDIRTDEISRFYEGGDTRSTFCPPTFFIPHL